MRGQVMASKEKLKLALLLCSRNLFSGTFHVLLCCFFVLLRILES
jgi:hypothetical protein